MVQPEISNAALALKGPDTQPETIKSRGRTSIIPKSMFQIVWNLMGFTESNGMQWSSVGLFEDCSWDLRSEISLNQLDKDCLET